MTSVLDERAPVLERPTLTKRPRWWGEVLVIVWLCWAYDAIANLAPLRQHAALRNAASLLDAERAVHLDPEAALDHWLRTHHTLAVLLSNYYDNTHFVVTLGLVGWLWWSFADLYRPLRNSLVMINVAGMVVFWLVPTAPPRLFRPDVYTDVVASTHAFGSWHAGTLATAANQLAAMPSLHIAWACWSALALQRILKGSRAAPLVWVYPAFTSVVVMATGNHWLLDAVAGAATFVLCIIAADRLHGWLASRQASRMTTA